MPMRTFTQNEPVTDAELERLGDFAVSELLLHDSGREIS
jgi:hypothetical protein